MYASHGFSTPFSVKDILTWTEQQSHCGLDFQTAMNYPMGTNFALDSQRMGDQYSSIGNNPSCLYGGGSPVPSAPTALYTNMPPPPCTPPGPGLHLKEEYDASPPPLAVATELRCGEEDTIEKSKY